MKKIILNLLMVLFVFVGCGGGGGGTSTDNQTNNGNNNNNTNTRSISESLRGNWMYVVDGTSVYIDESFAYPITTVSDTLISIVKDNKTYYLMRNGIDTTQVKGSLYADSSLSRSITRDLRANSIASINIILKHATDDKNKKELTLQDTSDFAFQNVKSGNYLLTATTDNNLSVKSTVNVQDEEITLGSFKLVADDGYNFKTDFVMTNSDNSFFYGNLKTYTGKLKINNIGNKKGTGLNYSFKTDSGYVSSFSNDIILGTVDVNKSIEIPFRISFNVLDKTKVTVPLNITIKDVNNHEWVDTVFFDVYQTPMNVKIKTKVANVKGYIILPGNQLTKIDTSDATILIPYREGKKYYLVLSNPNIASETPYSIGVDANTLSFDTFQDTSAHEPNNKESEAFTIRPGENIVSYLHEGDIDYYVIDMTSSTDVGLFSPPTIPFK